MPPAPRSSGRALLSITDDDLSALMPGNASAERPATGSTSSQRLAVPAPNASGKFARVGAAATPQKKKIIRKKSAPALAAQAGQTSETSAALNASPSAGAAAGASKPIETPLRPPPLAELLEGHVDVAASATNAATTNEAPPFEREDVTLALPSPVDATADVTLALPSPVGATADVTLALPSPVGVTSMPTYQQHTVLISHDQLRGRPAEAPSVFDPSTREPAAVAPAAVAPAAREETPSTSPAPAKRGRALTASVIALLAIGLGVAFFGYTTMGNTAMRRARQAVAPVAESATASEGSTPAERATPAEGATSAEGAAASAESISFAVATPTSGAAAASSGAPAPARAEP
ncbi:MAG: hypothetical protein KF795_22785, partial [Labilithrix sp.]|nr:hypothetical protein [Labilithrix sp.]